jgi:hypothetical protein
LDGLVNFNVTYNDSAGNAGTAMTNVTDGTSVIVDKTPPTGVFLDLFSGNPTPTFAKRDDNVTLLFSTNEFIYRPTVEFMSPTRNCARCPVHVEASRVTCDATNQNWSRWSCVYTVESTDAIGLLSFRIDFQDSTGNKRTNFTTAPQAVPSDIRGYVDVDVTTPDMKEVTLTSDNGALPTIATSGDRITLRFAANEQIRRPVCQFFSTNGSRAGHCSRDSRTSTVYQPNSSDCRPAAGHVQVNQTRVTADGKSEHPLGLWEWTCSYIVDANDFLPGSVDFHIDFQDYSGNDGYPATTVLGGTLATFEPCSGSLCMITIDDWAYIFGGVSPASANQSAGSRRRGLSVSTGMVGSNLMLPSSPSQSFRNDSQQCYFFASDKTKAVDTGAGLTDAAELCTSRPHCTYGPAYSHLGLLCKICTHPRIVNGLRTTCKRCEPGFGPNVQHTACVKCLPGTFSAFGECVACPVGATNNAESTDCTDENECLEDNNNGCDVLATRRGPFCINHDFTGIGYACGTCPDGCTKQAIYKNVTVIRRLTHGGTTTVHAQNLFSGTKCISAPSDRNPGVQPLITLRLENTSTSDLHMVPSDQRHEIIVHHIRSHLGIRRPDILLLPSHSLQVKFIIRSGSSHANARALAMLLRNGSSSLMHNYSSGRLVGIQPNQSLEHPAFRFVCPQGTVLADSKVECVRCAPVSLLCFEFNRL